jgi:glycosyltransferase involved in cell wall biosynthesis
MRIARNAVRKMMNEYGHFDSAENPSVSVVIPAYNEGGNDYLSRSIESALGQSYKPSEVIVVDDGSTDGTAEIASGYEGVQVLRTENMGVAHARNYGAERAKGDIVVWMDADSCMESGLLEKVADSIGRGHYVGGTARTTPDTNGATESFLYGAGNVVAKVTNAFGNTKRLTPGGFMYCSRECADRIKEKYGVLFPDGTSEDRQFVNWVAEEGMVDRLDIGITTSARRERKNGLIGSLWDQFQRSTTPAGVAHDGYPVIREGAKAAA